MEYGLKLMPKIVESVLPRTGYSSMYAGFPIHFVSKIQTDIALSTSEAEYIALSQALHEVIPLMTFMEEINTTYPVLIGAPEFIYTVH